MQLLLDNELHLLQEEGYNPITKQMSKPRGTVEVHPNTLFLNALECALKLIKIAASTRADMKSMLRVAAEAAANTFSITKPISQIRRRDVVMLLEQIEHIKGDFSAHRYNKYRSYLMSLFNKLLELEAIDINPAREILKQKTTKKIRNIITIEDIKRINETIVHSNYNFWRFLQIFFHSGARIVELLALKVGDVDFKESRFKVLVKKGRNYTEMYRPIRASVLPLWQELINDSPSGYYIFSKGLQPGEHKIRYEQITRRWKVHIKDKLGIEADCYSLKHRNLEETAKLYGISVAAAGAGHATPVITMKYYAPGEMERMKELYKNSDVLIG
ncbi:MAG TPA: hypothetical protein DCQ29_01915 [Chitinophagaceae bacterium]|nr:hypothetical protein [Chitinophagaceae bacterium]